jgi:hypothetical protein
MKSATLALFLAGTCAAAPLMAGPGIAAGESLTFRVSWGLFHRAGEINIAARQVLAKEATPSGLHIVTTTATRGGGPSGMRMSPLNTSPGRGSRVKASRINPYATPCRPSPPGNFPSGRR